MFTIMVKPMEIQSSAALVVAAVATIAVDILLGTVVSNCFDKLPRHWIQRSVQEVYTALGPLYFRRAYRMIY